MQSKEHWERVYATKPADGVSWFQEHAGTSLRLIRGTGVPPAARIIDVGGGASTLVDDLILGGYTSLTVLDLSGTALGKSKLRLGARGDRVDWLEGDVTRLALPRDSYDVWHDRAAFHFLIDEADRRAYVAQALHSVRPGGHVIVATFAEDGPTRCSELTVARYSPAALHAEFGDAFELLEQCPEEHLTPFGTRQRFIYCHFRKR
jgi:SAM-dependent methyltransferase